MSSKGTLPSDEETPAIIIGTVVEKSKIKIIPGKVKTVALRGVKYFVGFSI